MDLENIKVCPDPGEPENGIRRVKSFAQGRLASCGCKPGFTYYETDLRTYTADEQNNKVWDGEDGYCQSMYFTNLICTLNEYNVQILEATSSLRYV